MKAYCWLSGLVMAGVISAHAAAGTAVRLATVLPEGVEQQIILKDLLQKMTKASGGAAQFTLAPGGQADGESKIAMKLGSRIYQAALLSTVGLGEIHKDITALQNMPLVYRSWAEVDYVREKLRGKMEGELLQKGYVTLFWADAGWVNFFSTKAATRPSDFKRLKMFNWAGNPEQVKIMKELGYQPISLETEDIPMGFQNGLIECAPLPPVIAMKLQVTEKATHFVNVDWAPIVGACVVRKDVWEKIPEHVRPELLKLADAAGEAICVSGRKLHEQAVETLRKKPGMTVHSPTAEERVEWEQLAAELGPKVRGAIVPGEAYDEVQGVLRVYRAGGGN